jgi:hypothetical protein
MRRQKATVGCPGGILKDLLDLSIEALAQQAGKLAVLPEAEAEHLGDGLDILPGREIAQILSLAN